MPKRPTTTITRAVEEEFDSPPAKKQYEVGDTFSKDGKVYAEPGLRGEEIQSMRDTHIMNQAMSRTQNWFRFKYGKKSTKRNLGEDLDQPKIESAFANIKKKRNIKKSQFEPEESEFNNDNQQVEQFNPPEMAEPATTEAMEEGGEGGAGVKGKRVGSGMQGGGGAAAVGSPSGALMPISRPIRPPGDSTWYIRTYTKTFLFAIENCNWVRANKDGYQGGPTVHVAQAPYYCFPLDRKFMYIDPIEWLNLHDNKSIVKCLDTRAQFRYKSYRPYFVSGGTDVQVASNTATPYINVYCGMRHKMPYQIWENTNPTTATDPGNILLFDPNTQDAATYTKSGWTFCEDFMDRLYGDAYTGFGETASESSGLFLSNTGSVGAIDGPRRWYLRPAWHCNAYVHQSGQPRVPRSIGDYISGMHLEANKELEFPGTALGAGFETSYEPSNALWKAAQSIKLDPAWAAHLDQFAVGSNTAGAGNLGVGFIPYMERAERMLNMSVAGGILSFSDNYGNYAAEPFSIMTNADWEMTGGSPSQYDINQRLQRSYFGSIDQMAVQDPMSKGDLNPSGPKDIWIGVTPQIQTDNTLLRGVTEIELKTEMRVAIKVHDSHFAHRINLARRDTSQTGSPVATVRDLNDARELSTRIFDESAIHVNEHIHDFHTGYTIGGRIPRTWIATTQPAVAAIDKIRQTPTVKYGIKPSGSALN